MLGRVISFIVLIATLGIFSAGSVNGDAILSGFQKRIPIAAGPDWEMYPTIAYCPATDQFLVVFTDNEHILGQHLDGLGNKLGSTFRISTVEGYLTPLVPVVACTQGPSEAAFMVAWYYDSHPAQTIFIQAVYASHQVEPLTQLFGDPISFGDTESYFDQPEIACSLNTATCILAYIDSSELAFQRVALTSSGIVMLGDIFSMAFESRDQHNINLAWNEVEDNYLFSWAQQYGEYSYGIAYTHVYAEEQGYGLDEKQHPILWIYTPTLAYDECGNPHAAFNPLTDKFALAFSCELKVFFQRVNGSGTGLQGGLVNLSEIEGSYDSSLYGSDIWFVNRSGGEKQFMLAMVIDLGGSTVEDRLYLIPLKGEYDPVSVDQLDGEFTLLIDDGDLHASGTGNGNYSRSILVSHEFGYNGTPDIYTYLFAPYVYRFTQIYKN